MTITEKAVKLLEECSEAAVASINDDLYPRICMISILKRESFDTLYFSTGTISEKVKHFKRNPKASACYYKNGHSVTLIGKIEIITDIKIKSEIWQDWLINHFPKGVDDENYCLLKFKADAATLWIDGEFKTVDC